MKNELSKEDQERIEKEMLGYGTSANYSLWTDGFKEGAEYEHPIAYNKGLEDGAGYFNKESFNEAIEEAVRLIDQMEDYIPSSISEAVDKLKRK